MSFGSKIGILSDIATHPRNAPRNVPKIVSSRLYSRT